jgi:type I restriction enzyme, S subunit
MIDGAAPHPTYRAASLPWLSRIPSGWEVRRIKSLFRERDDRSTDGTGELLSLTRARGILPQSEASTRIASVDNLSGYKRCRPGDLVMNRMQAWSGMFAVSSFDGLVSPDYSVFRAIDDVDQRYFTYLFKTPLLVDQFAQLSKGVGSGFNRLYTPEFGAVPVVVPPRAEQEAIVRFLDHADRRVRRVIRAKQKLIELLNEQKQAVIHRAVTRGLGPNVRLTPSGIDWLGELPEGWTLRRFKFVASVARGQVDPREQRHRDKVLIAPNHIKSGAGKVTALQTAHEQGADSGKYELRSGQIVYSKIRPHLRKAAISPIDGLCSADMYPISLRGSELRSEYALLLLLSLPFTRYAVDCSLRVAMPKINREALGNAWLWYPSLDEQGAILQSIERTVAPLDAAILRAEGEIGLLREYRTRLIVEVATGKIDVRGAAAQLPDGADESEPLDEIALDDVDDADVGTLEPVEA